MQPPTFTRQSDAVLFPKVLWNRPVSRAGAGRLLVIGGHQTAFSEPTALYGLVTASGIGECAVALPDSLLKLLAGTPATTFVASNTSGSLGLGALGRLIELADEADGVMIGADLSNNSETAVLLEQFLRKSHDRPVVVFGEAFTALQFNLRLVADRRDALVIATMPELFKIAASLGIGISIRPDGGLVNKVEIVERIKRGIAADLVVYGTDTIVAVGDALSVTPANPVLARLPAAYYAVLGVMWLQNLSNRYQGLTTGAWVLAQAARELDRQELPTPGNLATRIAATLDQAAF